MTKHSCLAFCFPVAEVVTWPPDSYDITTHEFSASRFFKAMQGLVINKY